MSREHASCVFMSSTSIVQARNIQMNLILAGGHWGDELRRVCVACGSVKLRKEDGEKRGSCRDGEDVWEVRELGDDEPDVRAGDCGGE